MRDTPAMARILNEDFKDKGHQIKIYPDASGANTTSKNASESDLSILRQAGFQIEVNPANPAVKDRVNGDQLLHPPWLLGSNQRRKASISCLASDSSSPMHSSPLG